MNQRDKIDCDYCTIELKRRLYEVRDTVLNHLVFNDPDQAIMDLLEKAESRISYWSKTHHEYLVTDDDYYSSITHRILEPVYHTLSFRNGDDDVLEEERDQAIEERDKLAEELETLRSNVNHYYGSFGGCNAWERAE